MMRIALVYHRFHPNTGGVETYIRRLAEQYAEMGHHAAVFTSEPCYRDTKNRHPSGKTEEGYEVRYVKPVNFLGYPLPRKEAMQALREFDPQVIHLNSPHPFSTIFALQARKLKKPLVSTYHGHANPSGRFRKAVALMERRLYRFLFRLLIVTSDFYKREVAAFYPSAKIAPIPLGIDPVFSRCTLSRDEARDRLDIRHKRKIVLFVGALDPAHYYKGLTVLLDCAALTPETGYLVVGGGADKPVYEYRAESLSNVTFCGRVSAEKLPLYYRAADCLALPSTSNSEGFGLVLLEAMASGTPVVTTSAAGSSELIRAAGAGIIVKPGNALDLKEGIMKMLEEKKLHDELVAKGAGLVKSLTWSGTARRTLEIYDKLIRK